MATKKTASAGRRSDTSSGQAAGPATAPATPGHDPEQAPAAAPRRRAPARRTPGRVPARRRRGCRRTPMKLSRRPEAVVPLEEHLRARVIGQDTAVDALVGSWARLLAGLRDPHRPLLTALLLGPTGVGKTETARALAEALFGSEEALTRIDCEEYAHGHEVAKLLGSPPGYVGSDIEPLLSQRRIDRPHWEARQRAKQHDRAPDELLIEQVHDAQDGLHSILLFDEVEKAHPALWHALLGILEEGRVTLGNNQTTDLTRSIILMTSNVGSREMSTALERRSVGFVDSDSGLPAGLGEIARRAARDVFPVEFINRFDQVLVYEPLQATHLERIFDKFLGEIAQRALDRAEVPLLIQVTAAARDHVIRAGTDPALGARPLRRAMERLLVDPISSLIASGQLVAGDVVEIDLCAERLRFFRLPRSRKRVVA